jgi:hypothetical protein
MEYIQARSSLYANTQLRAYRRAEKKIKSKKNMEDRLPEPITLQTCQNSIGKEKKCEKCMKNE